MSIKKDNRGFSLVSAGIAVGVLTLVAGGGYIGVTEFNSFRIQQAEKEKQTQDSITAQQEALDEARREIEKLKEESPEVEERQNALAKENSRAVLPQEISDFNTSDIRPFVSGVVEISCEGVKGSGSLWKKGGLYFVLTNSHITDFFHKKRGSCLVNVESSTDEFSGVYEIYPLTGRSLRGSVDASASQLVSINEEGFIGLSDPISTLNYGISLLPKCSIDMPQGAPVIIVGYPSFGDTEFNFPGIPSGTFTTRIVSDGIISGHDITPRFEEGLVGSNYFVSAKIDSGNSGGIALSKTENGICLLGIPTWLNLGQYETQGVVQNIWNISLPGFVGN